MTLRLCMTLAAACFSSGTAAQTADFSVEFRDYSLTSTTVYFSEYATLAEETWYFGNCTDQLSPADLTLKVTEYAVFADVTVYPTKYAYLAEKVVCIIGEAPDELVDALR